MEREIYKEIDESIDWDVFEEEEDTYINEVEKEEKEPFKIRDEGLANWALRKLKKIDDDFQKQKEQTEYEIARLQDWIKTEEVRKEKKKFFFENRLQEYLDFLMFTDPKAKIKTPYGEVKYVKQQDEWKYDEEELMRFLEKEQMEGFIDVKKSINKREIKKLMVADGNAVTEAGEIVPGITVVKRPDTLRVKLD